MKTKRLLSLLLALCMVLSCLSLGALADGDEDDPEEPEEPGYECDTSGHEYGDDGYCIYGCGDYNEEYDMHADEDDNCEHQYGNDGICEFCGDYNPGEDLSAVGDPLSVGDTMIEPPAFMAWSIHAFTPTADGVYLFSFSCVEDAEAQLLDADSSCLASSWGENGFFAVVLTGGATYTLKVRYISESEAGAAVSVTVSIEALESAGALSVGNNSLATTDDGSWTLYSFTPAETGCYRFRSQGVHDPDAEMVGDNWNGSNNVDCALGNLNFNFLTYVELTAETTYFFLIKNCEEGLLSVPVIVDLVSDPDSETVPAYHEGEDGEDGYFDEGYFTYYGLPVYGTPEWCEAKGHDWDADEGECRICHTRCAHETWWADGTCKVCGHYDEAHEACGEVGAALRPGANALTLRGSKGLSLHAFTPAEAGVYRIFSATEAESSDPKAELYNDEGDSVTYDDDISAENRDFCLEAPLAADKTYTLRLRNLEATEAARSTVVTVEKLALGGVLALGENSAVIGSFYTFTPEVSAKYAFFSTGEYDTKGTLWSSEGEFLEWNDDAEDDDDNFRFSAVLTAGTVYVFKLDGSEDERGETCNVTVEQAALTAWETLQQLLNSGAPTVKLTQDYTATADDNALVVPENTGVTLDLNGKILDGSALDAADVLIVEGELTLEDSAGGGRLVAAGGDDAVYVDGGSFTMNGGTISITGAEYGAVFGSGSVYIIGGAISADNAAAVHMASGTLYAAAPISVTVVWGFTDGTNVYPAGTLTAAQYRELGFTGRTLYLFGVSGRWDGDLLTVQYTAPAGSLLIAAAYDASGRQASVWCLRNTELCSTGNKHTGLFRRHGAIFKLLLVDQNYAPLCVLWESDLRE